MIKIHFLKLFLDFSMDLILLGQCFAACGQSLTAILVSSSVKGAQSATEHHRSRIWRPQILYSQLISSCQCFTQLSVLHFCPNLYQGFIQCCLIAGYCILTSMSY